MVSPLPTKETRLPADSESQIRDSTVARSTQKAQSGTQNSLNTHSTNTVATGSTRSGRSSKVHSTSPAHTDSNETGASGKTANDVGNTSAGSGSLSQPVPSASATDDGGYTTDSTSSASGPEDTAFPHSSQPANNTASAADAENTAFPSDSQQSSEVAPAWNLKNITCDDFLGIRRPADKWNATDGDNAVQDFVNMYNSDTLYCPECFGYTKEQCDSESKLCSEGIRTRATPEGGNPSWTVAAALFGKYDNADRFTCQIGPNECATAPKCEELNDGDGASSAALLQSVSNAYLSFQTNYDAIQEAGHACDTQMNKFSDVFAPVPDSEGEIIALIVLTALLGGLTAFLGLAGGAMAGIAVGIGSGIGMEKFFMSKPGPQDTSGTLGLLVDEVLKTYSEMTNRLFQDGEFSHPSSDGRTDVKITLQNMAREGKLVSPDMDPESHFTGLKPIYKRILFQQLALVTWTSLAVDGKTHVPFIAFDKGACDQVDGEKEGSLEKVSVGLEGIKKLDVQFDYQGDCYYLLDGVPGDRATKSAYALCGAKALPGGTNKALSENAEEFSKLEVADFIIPSVLGWQAHAKTNGYPSAAANGNLIKDIRAPGVVNIPVCDYLTDPKHPGVGCPVIGRVKSETKCDVIGAGEGSNQPGQYSQGGCRAHVTQWQKNEVKNNANQLPDYQLSVDIYDQTNRIVGSATKQSAAKPLEVTDTSLPYNLIVVPGAVDSDPVSFWYADQYWTSKDTGDPHKCNGGDGDGKEYDHGARQMDCNFACPLPNSDEDPPVSATIDHPLPTPAVEAVPGVSSFVNTWSKTAGPAAAAATPTYASGVCPMKITQYQKNLKDSNPTNHFQLEISVKDANGGQAASFAKQPCPIGEPKVMQGLKGGDFTITIGKNLDGPLDDSTPISFSWRGEDFDTDTLKCRHGGLSKDIVPWLAINSSIPPLSEALSKLKTQLREINPEPYPFLNSTVPQVYAFFKSHIRQPEDAIRGHSLAHFTFLAVDAQCVRPSSSPPEPVEPRYRTGSNFTILVCTDAPDFYESDDEPRLKTLRLPIAAAFQHLEQIDELVITPSELYTRIFENEHANTLRLMPPACLYPIPPYTDDEDEQEYKLGSFAQMRERKKQGLRLGEQSLMGPGSL
ncbi:MAG: hypothetical protein Q9208_001013 [Pyrenodesmia sp. 3 TL-2023]